MRVLQTKAIKTRRANMYRKLRRCLMNLNWELARLENGYSKEITRSGFSDYDIRKMIGLTIIEMEHIRNTMRAFEKSLDHADLG